MKFPKRKANQNGPSPVVVQGEILEEGNDLQNMYYNMNPSNNTSTTPATTTTTRRRIYRGFSSSISHMFQPPASSSLGLLLILVYDFL